MKKLHAKCATAVVVFLCTSTLLPVHAQTGTNQKGSLVAHNASGTFEVKVSPLALEDKTEGTMLGRMALDKQFRGDLEGTSRGEMLTAGTTMKGSAGYVAMERVNGVLNGRKGTFVLQHAATMTRGEPKLSITVVPDSGTGKLTGLAGRMDIKIEGGRHSYEF